MYKGKNDKYTDLDNHFVFPRHDIDPKDKKADWHRKWCEAIYAKHLRNQGGILYSKTYEFETFRLYADGNQPVEKYLDILVPTDPKTGERTGLMNISWDMLSVLPKIRQVVVGNLMKLEHDISADAVDEKSEGEREDYKLKLYAEKKTKDFMEGIAPGSFKGEFDDVIDFVPESLAELEMLMSMGGFKLKYEIQMETFIKHSFNMSNWNSVLKRKIYEDLFDLSVAATKDYVEPSTQKVKTRYVDPSKLIIPYSRDHSFSDIGYAGEVIFYTIADLRKAAPELDEEEIFEIAKTWAEYHDITDNYNWGAYSYDKGNSTYHYDDIRVGVLDAEWLSYDVEVRSIRNNPNGETRIHMLSYDTNKKDSETRKVHKSKLQTVHRCKWVIGSEIVFDYGYQHDVPNKSYNERNLSFRVYKLSNKSKVSSVIPLIDSIQLAWFRMQHAITKAAPSGLAVEMGALTNISLGGNKMNPLDILTIRRETGDLIFKSTTHYDRVVSPNSGKPITETRGGVGPYLDEIIKTMEINMKQIRDITGINEFIDSSTADPNVPVSHGKLAVGAANNILHTMYLGYKYIKEETAKNMAFRWQIVARYNDVKAVVHALGKHNIEIIKAGSNVAFTDWGINIELKPDDQQRQEIRLAAKESLNAKRSGGVGISMSDYTYILRLIDSGRLKMAEVVLAYREEVQRRREEQKQAELEQMRAEGAQNLEREKQNTVQVTEEARANREIAVERQKSLFRIEEENNRHMHDMERKDQDSDSEIRKKTKELRSQERNVDKQTEAQKESSI